MNYDLSPAAVAIFVLFVGFVLWISFYFARKTRDAKGYFAAGGQIHWGVNGIAVAGDYLSAASFLGIAGMIAVSGYDGFLYSIGYLAGWVVALFVVAEPLKRMGRYTFSDALDARFNSKAIQLAAGISALVVSVCYLIPQMVGAGALVKPLLGLPHHIGVAMVGTIVILIVATAGMTSTTFVQFMKGGLLIIFSTVLVGLLLWNGFATKPSEKYHEFKPLPVTLSDTGEVVAVEDPAYQIVGQTTAGGRQYVKLDNGGVISWWSLGTRDGQPVLNEALSVVTTADGKTLYNGGPIEEERFFQVGHFNRLVVDGEEVDSVKHLNPVSFLTIVSNSEVVRFTKKSFTYEGESVTLYVQTLVSGDQVMRPGVKFKLDEGATTASRLDFVSLMLALFFGTSALPHVLIRYYTVPSQRAARKSTVVAIAAIGFFYILTLYMGLGAMVNGVLDVENSNMSAPLLAKYFGVTLFAVVSALAFATVLGTVAGLIVAASGAVVHDLMSSFFGIKLTERKQIISGKIAAIAVGALAILLGIYFENENVSFLVGLAFAVAASANLPAIMMVLFWKKTTAKGVAASVVVGMVSSLTLIALSPTMYEHYGRLASEAPFPLENPGIVSIPLSFATVILVSLLTQPVYEQQMGTEIEQLPA